MSLKRKAAILAESVQILTHFRHIEEVVAEFAVLRVDPGALDQTPDDLCGQIVRPDPGQVLLLGDPALLTGDATEPFAVAGDWVWLAQSQAKGMRRLARHSLLVGLRGEVDAGCATVANLDHADRSLVAQRHVEARALLVDDGGLGPAGDEELGHAVFNLLESNKIRLVNASSDVDYSTPEGRMMLSIDLGLGSYWSRKMSFHIKKAKDRLKNQILGETKIKDIIDGLAAAEPSEVAAVAGLLDQVDSLLNKK